MEDNEKNMGTESQMTECDEAEYRQMEAHYERWLAESNFPDEESLFRLLRGHDIDLKTFVLNRTFSICIVDGKGERLIELGSMPCIRPFSRKRAYDVLLGAEVIGMILFDRFYGKENNFLRERALAEAYDTYDQMMKDIV